jgi:ADP-ribose pyrophosphatase
VKPRVLSTRVEYTCPWLVVRSKDVDLGEPRGRERFWSVQTNDYAAVLAVTEDGLIPLVRQFRPAVDTDVLELPSGAVDPDEEPAEAMRRELWEETGCRARELVPLGMLHTDSGRMETRQWAFFAPGVERGDVPPGGDEQLELLFVEPGELRRFIVEGKFNMSVHLGVLATALVGGHVQL